MEILDKIGLILEGGVFGLCVYFAYLNRKKDETFLSYIKDADKRHDEIDKRQQELLSGFLLNITELNGKIDAGHEKIASDLSEIKLIINGNAKP